MDPICWPPSKRKCDEGNNTRETGVHRWKGELQIIVELQPNPVQCLCFSKVLVDKGFGRDVRQNASKSSVSAPAFRYPQSLPSSQSPPSQMEVDSRLGLPPKVHRISEPPLGLPASFGPLSPTLVPSSGSTAIQDTATPRLMPVSTDSAAAALSNLSISTLGLRGRHVLTASTFTRDQLHQLFNIAHTLRSAVQHDRSLDALLKVNP